MPSPSCVADRAAFMLPSVACPVVSPGAVGVAWVGFRLGIFRLAFLARVFMPCWLLGRNSDCACGACQLGVGIWDSPVNCAIFAPLVLALRDKMVVFLESTFYKRGKARRYLGLCFDKWSDKRPFFTAGICDSP